MPINIPEKRLAQLILDTYGIKISAATLARLIAKKAKEMNPFAEAVNDQLSGEQTAVKHLDETGLRVAGKTRWIHVLCSIALSYFRLGVSSGDVPKYLLGTAVHDCFTSNWTLNLNSAVGARQSSGKLLMLNQCLCLENSTMANPFGEAF